MGGDTIPLPRAQNSLGYLQWDTRCHATGLIKIKENKNALNCMATLADILCSHILTFYSGHKMRNVLPFVSMLKKKTRTAPLGPWHEERIQTFGNLYWDGDYGPGNGLLNQPSGIDFLRYA